MAASKKPNAIMERFKAVDNCAVLFLDIRGHSTYLAAASMQAICNFRSSSETGPNDSVRLTAIDDADRRRQA
ncbi:MAG: hypothetical protein HY744_19200 [Deltaproteobacteria bacterium]|nr:hypothetical protein [Deltaproteobacteria bacterium]